MRDRLAHAARALRLIGPAVRRTGGHAGQVTLEHAFIMATQSGRDFQRAGVKVVVELFAQMEACRAGAVINPTVATPGLRRPDPGDLPNSMVRRRRE